jgi:type I restriction enzyme M protein
VSRGSGNTGRNKERDVRRWFVEQDLVDGIVYLPENLFYNTSAPGIILVLDKAKPDDRRGTIILVNASTDFTKGEPKNYLSDDAINRIVATLHSREEIERYSRIVRHDEIAASDFNLSPTRYIHSHVDEDHRPIEAIAKELEDLEEQAQHSSAEVQALLRRLRA